jgi:hypothetical protein
MAATPMPPPSGVANRFPDHRMPLNSPGYREQRSGLDWRKPYDGHRYDR